MRILICNYEYPPIGGGGGVTTKRLAEELAKKHSVTVLTSAFDGAALHEVLESVEIYRVPVLRRMNMHTASLISMLLFWPMSFLKGSRLCRERKFDILNSHFAIPTGPGSIMLSRKFGIPHILSIHGGDIFDPSKKLSPHQTWGLHWAVQSIINLSKRVLAQSFNTRDNAYKYYKINKPIKIIPHAIKRPIFKKIDRESLGFNKDDFLLISIGRLVSRKGAPYLVEMMSRIGDKRVKLLVLGDGPEKASLEKMVSQLGLGDSISFMGWVSEEEKFQLLSISDLYVSSSLHEGFGLIFIEAMACGLAIVAFDNGGHRDFLVDGNTGYLVPVGNIDLFCERVNELIEHQELRNAAGSVNRQLAENYYIEKCAALHEKVFEEAILRYDE